MKSAKSDMVMDLMDRYEWMPASIARFMLERGVDFDRIAREEGL